MRDKWRRQKNWKKNRRREAEIQEEVSGQTAFQNKPLFEH